jgi:AAA domain, putative AbiEii toxin, Type IV TA system
MYITKVDIKNIRSISHFEMTFDKPAGWHVLIGDNGAGKSSIVRAIAIALIGPSDAQALRLPLISWIKQETEQGSVSLTIERDKNLDGHAGQKAPLKQASVFDTTIKITREETSGLAIGRIDRNGKNSTDPYEYIWSGKRGWFSTSFGPFRRFTGGDKEWSKVYYSNPAAAAHLSVFGEDVALTESLEWLSQMKFKSLEQNSSATNILEGLKKFINEGDLLPHNAQIVDITSSGVFFQDGNGKNIDVTQLSDGFRSLLSLIFELIRQLVKTYGENEVFKNIQNNKTGTLSINLPGVVLIDEIDAHLHPTWQTRIGQWFTKYFPNIQFIVTTHSPLVCRACENGSIWRLAAPGSENESGEITGLQKERLIFGNILDAYGTELFGSEPVRSQESEDKLSRLGQLNIKFALGKTTRLEETERLTLQQILSTDAPTGF